ncbi:MAG: MBL fold metallo-hydrolase [Planctomycetaceae bacterium]|nr:MBL fold metallo-hydrolase [Planctomycetaceae bacterium]
MYLQRFYLECLSHASYIVADETSKIAAVIDPQRDVDIYIDDAREQGLEIKYVILTHFHADFVAGHIELRDRVGARIAIGAKGNAEFDHLALKDGDVIDLGGARLKVLETPGHTPEGITLLAYEANAGDDEPYAAFTGDTLFIGDVGRPDLLASIGVTAQELGEMLYDSLHNKLLPLPDSTLVYPAHGAGSMCGKQLSDEAVSTIGDQRKYNYALQPMSKQQFMDLVTEEQPTAPQYFVYDAITNRQERESLEKSMSKSMRGLSVDEVLELQQQGAQVVDVREAIDFEGGHLRGTLNVGLQGKYATWAGSVLNHDTPIVVIAEEGNEEEAVMRLGRIGYDNVVGYLQDGMRALETRPDLTQSVKRVTAPALQELLDDSNAPLVIDVRTEKERHSTGHVPNSVNIPLAELHERIAEVPADRTVAVHCAGGYRSAIAASLLQQADRDVLDIVGGFKAWVASGLPVEEAVEASAAK